MQIRNAKFILPVIPLAQSTPYPAGTAFFVGIDEVELQEVDFAGTSCKPDGLRRRLSGSGAIDAGIFFADFRVAFQVAVELAVPLAM